jgi:hypothetical protein
MNYFKNLFSSQSVEYVHFLKEFISPELDQIGVNVLIDLFIKLHRVCQFK